MRSLAITAALAALGSGAYSVSDAPVVDESRVFPDPFSGAPKLMPERRRGPTYQRGTKSARQSERRRKANNVKKAKAATRRRRK